MMLSTYSCPSCSDRLLRHVSQRGLYWRCSHCREEFAANYPFLGVEVKRNNILCLSTFPRMEAAIVS